MQMDSIGKYIRKYRQAQKLRQDDLAEKTGLSTNYIGMVERGEKVPALDTFVTIVNALGVSADMVLCDVVDRGFEVKNTILLNRVQRLSPEEQARFYAIADAFLEQK